MTVKIIGDSPRPWVLTIGVDPDSTFARDLKEMFPTVTPIDDTSAIRQLDYNAAIVVGEGWQHLEPHLQIVWFADSGLAPVQRSEVHSGYVASDTRWEDGDRASRFIATTLASEESVASLVENLAPTAAGAYRVLSQTPWLEDLRQPLLCEVGGRQDALAAIYDRNPTKESEVWCLPTRALSEASIWATAALRRWRRRFPQEFPSADWAADEKWQTAAEQAAQSELVAHGVETARLLKARRGEQIELEAAVQRARATADSGARRLLTTNGEPLVAAVVEALEQLGFDVTQSDKVLPPGHKREDLLVADHDWISVTEVKGYEKGNAKQNDLLPLGSAVESYVLRTREKPAARWYIVNQCFRTAPGLRPRPLAGAGDTVQKFVDQQGLVIDTRDLFAVTQAVQNGQLTADDARELLRTDLGVFDYQSETAGGRELGPSSEQLVLPPGTDHND